MIYFFDRCEKDIAVLQSEDGSFIKLLISDLPVGAHEGSVLKLTSDGYVLCKDKEKKRRSAVFDLLNSVTKDQ